MCCVDGEGATVSASSCVTRLISLQPGRLGPEGSGGGGAGPHSPSDKYVFRAAVLKGHGRGGGGGGVDRTVPGCWVPAEPSMSCVTPSRGMRRFRKILPSSWSGPPHPWLCSEGEAVVDTQIFKLWNRQTSQPMPPISRER
jgi:hypothetical protein